MTDNEKQLLLKDLCARLPYGVICQMEDKLIINDSPFYDYTLSERHIDIFRNHKDFYIKPYLRPMSSMTEEEEIELSELFWNSKADYQGATAISDFCYAHHLDNHDLIPAGLALEAPEGMYN